MHRLAVALLALVPLAAGCLQGATLTPGSAAPGLDLAPAAEQLWLDPQDAPHPAFGWPTLANPATGEGVPEWWRPIEPAELPERIGGIAHFSQSPEEVRRGGGIALFGSLAVVPGYGNPTAVLDISDPAEPKVLSLIEQENGNHRGAAIIPYPDGRLVFVVSTPKTIEVFDITDPTAPKALPNLTVERSHKVGVVPGTPIVYNANSRGANGASPLDANTGNGMGKTEIFDLTDPEDPVLVQEFENGYGCHQVYFWNSAEKQRAICAGVQYTQIWDIADPRNPVVISSVPVHHGNPMLPSTSVMVNALAFSHFSILNDDGTVLIVGDETGGGGMAACDGKGPFGNLWFYDVKNEKEPKLLGWIDPGPYFLSNPPSPGAVPGCTAHHGRLVPDPEGKRDLLAMAFYGAGTVLVDFTDPTMPRIVDQFNDGANTWEVWYYNGYLFTGDLARGLDVLKFE